MKPALVTSRANPLVVRLRKLASDPAAYRKQGEVWLEGEHLCAAYAAAGGRALHAVATEAAWGDSTLRGLIASAEKATIVDDAVMRALATLDSPAKIAFAVRWPGPGMPRRGVPTVVLDRVQDAGNVGSILRSAAAFGFAQVIALAGTAALWSPKVVRAAQGAHFALGLVEGADERVLDAIDVPLVATGSHAGNTLAQATLPAPCAWVFGHEGQGVAPALIARCAMTVRIEQPGGQESLNVAAAAAICLHAARVTKPASP